MGIDPVVVNLHESVARQHHLFVKLLPEPVRSWSILYYCLFRLIDSVEDSLLSHARKSKLLKSIEKRESTAFAEAAKAVTTADGLEESHRELALNWRTVQNAFDGIDPAARKPVEKTASVMAARMRHFADRLNESEKEKPYFLKDLPELNDYCHAVAGCVGELNIELFQIAGFLDPKIAKKARSGGIELGRYLQLVNIIRDAAEDRSKRGRFFFPISIRNRNPEDQIAAIVEFARKKEPAIDEFLRTISGSPAEKYCRTLHSIAKIHLEHFSIHPEVFDRKSSPPISLLFKALPIRLKAGLLAHKAGKLFS